MMMFDLLFIVNTTLVFFPLGLKTVRFNGLHYVMQYTHALVNTDEQRHQDFLSDGPGKCGSFG